MESKNYICPFCKETVIINDNNIFVNCSSCGTSIPVTDIRCSECLSNIHHFLGMSFCTNPECNSYQNRSKDCELVFDCCSNCNRKLYAFGKHLVNYQNKCLIFINEKLTCDQETIKIALATDISFRRLFVRLGIKVLSDTNTIS